MRWLIDKLHLDRKEDAGRGERCRGRGRTSHAQWAHLPTGA
jgi:hypothetical protein